MIIRKLKKLKNVTKKKYMDNDDENPRERIDIDKLSFSMSEDEEPADLEQLEK